MTSTDTGEPVAWRYLSKAKNAKWTVQKNKPVNSFVADCEVEPLYPASALTAQEDEIKRLREALEWYANPEIYKPHPHGPAFDRRDLSFRARATLDAPKGDANG